VTRVRRNKTMRRVLVAFGVVAIALVASSLMISATDMPETITIDDCVAKKSAVAFNHKTHLEVAECASCHHTQEGLTAESGDTVEKCGSCHVEPEKDTTPVCSQMSSSKNPYHINCTGCHKEMVKADPALKAPTKCDGCHPKA
jgi:hypothetical protein